MIMRTNGNGQGELPVTDQNALRKTIFAILSRSQTSVEQDLKVLTQCASHIRNTRLVEKIAKSARLKLSGFLVNDGLELYYDITRGKDDIGHISKGWEDPGFRLGDLVTFPRSKAAKFKTALPQIQKFCAVNGIGMTFGKTKDAIEIQMDGVIYSEGFNKKTFVSTLDTLHECVEKAKELIG